MELCSRQLTALSVSLGLAMIAGVTQASPVTYDYTSGGSITITALNESGKVIDLDGGTSVVIPLASQSTLSTVTFDSSASATNPLSAFVFTAAVPLTIDVTSGTFDGLDINFSALEMNNATGSTSTVSGSSFTAGPVSASGTYTLSGLVTKPSNSMTDTTSSIGGTITGAGPGEDFQLNGITLGTVTQGTHTVTLQANVEFNGAPVPIPSAVWLFGSGVALFGLPWLRRRRAV